MNNAMSVYDELGVKRVINAWGTMTSLGGSLMLPEVVEAMDEAATAFVDMDELQRQAGKVIAQKTGAEAAYVTSGAAAALVLAVAACMTGKDPEKMALIPYVQGFKNEVVLPLVQDTPFSRNFAIPCAKLVKVGTEGGYSPSDVERAITENTVAIAFVFFTSRRGCDMEALKEIVVIGKKHNVPVIVDAAAEVPPISNLHDIVATGADLVAFSGGKDIRGPNDAGFIMGRADLIEAVAAHSSPHNYMGRPMKVSKEQIVGLVVALQHYTPEAVKARRMKWEKTAQYFVKELSSENVKAETIVPDPAKHEYSAQGWPQTRLTLDEAKLGITAAEMNNKLKNGNPPIYASQSGNQVTLNPQCLRDGEEKIIVKRIREILEKKIHRKTKR
jgi:L-seryl-tRNA(Ser) seleniumtransferase